MASGRSQAVSLKTIVFVHQQLDVDLLFGVSNAPKTPQDPGRIRQGAGRVPGASPPELPQKMGGVHYVTLAAMVEGSGEENNAYAVMDILPEDTIRITGFRKQKSYQW